MGKIFYVMGKSASGKDTVYKSLKERFPQLRTVVIYTTRPAREGERDGVEYFFSDEAFLAQCRERGTLIESRTYQTACGPWTYFTADDGQIDLEHGDYLMIGTLESYRALREYYGREALRPVYLYVEDGLRLERAIARERAQKRPNYKELCRRYLADEEDFNAQRLAECGIERGYENVELSRCLDEIAAELSRELGLTARESAAQVEGIHKN